MLFALAFAELAGSLPAGRLGLQLGQEITHRGTAWMAGVALTLALVSVNRGRGAGLAVRATEHLDVFWIYGNGSGT